VPTLVYEDKGIIVRLGNPNDPNAPISPLATSYAYVWLDASANGSFPIYTSNSGTIGITLKVESSSNSSWAYCSVYKPNGSAFWNNVYVDPTTNNGNGYQGTMLFASSGTYTIVYAAYTTVGMRLMCWLY